jgi:thymidylate synthase
MALDCSQAWLTQLSHVSVLGDEVAPRDLPTRELLHQTVQVRPVLCCPTRKINYRFMCAEAYWILTGDDTVAGIAPYNSHIAQFSDDGQKFAGAYGPRVKDQLQWVVEKLMEDPSTRQAGLVIWRDKPTPSRDIPCTVAVWFSIRDNRLDVHVFMRSSDVWLGLPYDIFNFCMLGWVVMGLINQERLLQLNEEVTLLHPGSLLLTAVSSHLYQTNFAKADEVLSGALRVIQQPVPDHYITHPNDLINLLKRLREGDAERWWL